MEPLPFHRIYFRISPSNLPMVFNNGLRVGPVYASEDHEMEDVSQPGSSSIKNTRTIDSGTRWWIKRPGRKQKACNIKVKQPPTSLCSNDIILNAVFSILDLKSLKNCRFVCNYWNSTLQKFLEKRLIVILPMGAQRMFLNDNNEYFGATPTWGCCIVEKSPSDWNENTANPNRYLQLRECSKEMKGYNGEYENIPGLVRYRLFRSTGPILQHIQITLTRQRRHGVLMNTLRNILIQCPALEILNIQNAGDITYQYMGNLQNFSHNNLKWLSLHDGRQFNLEATGSWNHILSRIVVLFQVAPNLKSLESKIMDAMYNKLIEISVFMVFPQFQTIFLDRLGYANNVNPQQQQQQRMPTERCQQRRSKRQAHNRAKDAESFSFLKPGVHLSEALIILSKGDLLGRPKPCLNTKLPFMINLVELQMDDSSYTHFKNMDFLLDCPVLRKLIVITNPREQLRIQKSVNKRSEEMWHSKMQLIRRPHYCLKELKWSGPFQRKAFLKRIFACLPKLEKLSLSLGNESVFEQTLSEARFMQNIQDLDITFDCPEFLPCNQAIEKYLPQIGISKLRLNNIGSLHFILLTKTIYQGFNRLSPAFLHSVEFVKFVLVRTDLNMLQAVSAHAGLNVQFTQCFDFNNQQNYHHHHHQHDYQPPASEE